MVSFCTHLDIITMEKVIAKIGFVLGTSKRPAIIIDLFMKLVTLAGVKNEAFDHILL